MPSPLDRFAAADAILREALDCPPEARREFLARACGGDADLRGSVERLLAAAEQADSHVTPGGAVAGTLGTIWRRRSPATLAISPGAAGPYEVVALVGEGGMGRVYRASDPRLGRDVALKILSTPRDSRVSTERFGREARAASALNHPNIVTIYDIGDAGGVAYIAMEYLSGGSVRERLAGGRPHWTKRSISPARSRRDLPPHTPAAWSIATSSPATSWSPPMAARRSWTSGWPSSEPRRTATRWRAVSR